MSGLGVISAAGHARRIRLLRNDIHVILDEVIDSGVYHDGPRTERLAAIAGERWGGFPIPVSSGTMALTAAFRGLAGEPGDEVVVPAMTFPSTLFAAIACDLVPVVVDIDPMTRNLDPTAVEAAITPRTRAIVAVHLHGLAADMHRLGSIARRHGLAVIEDCAQAAGATQSGRFVGTFGDFGCFSLWVGKNLGGLGDAGLLIARDRDRVAMLRRWVDLGRDDDRNRHDLVGDLGRIDELDAAVVAHQLELLPQWIERRRGIAAGYSAAFTALPLRLPSDEFDRPHTYYKYAIQTASPHQANALMAHLADSGIAAEQVYPVPVASQPAFTSPVTGRTPGHRRTPVPVAERFARTHVCLPIYPELTDSEVERIIDAVTGYYRGEGASSGKVLATAGRVEHGS